MPGEWRRRGAGWPVREPEQVLRALLGQDLPPVPAEPLLEACTGVEQIQGLNQGKVLPHVPTQTGGERGLLLEGEEGGGGSEEPGEEGRKTEEVPI